MLYTERRRFPRFPFHSRACLNLAGAAYTGTLLDVSLKGALFQSAEAHAAMAGSECRIEILHVGEPGPLVVTARLAYQRRDLFGLEFISLDTETWQMLGDVMNMNLAVDSLLHRDLPELLEQSAG
jgi:hypothetical protein